MAPYIFKILRFNPKADPMPYFQEYNVGLLPVMEKGKIKGIVKRTAVMHHLRWGMKFGIR